MRKRRTFSREFKREAATMVLDQGFSFSEVCQELDVSESALRRWTDQVKLEAPSAGYTVDAGKMKASAARLLSLAFGFSVRIANR